MKNGEHGEAETAWKLSKDTEFESSAYVRKKPANESVLQLTTIAWNLRALSCTRFHFPFPFISNKPNLFCTEKIISLVSFHFYMYEQVNKSSSLKFFTLLALRVQTLSSLIPSTSALFSISHSLSLSQSFSLCVHNTKWLPWEELHAVTKPTWKEGHGHLMKMIPSETTLPNMALVAIGLPFPAKQVFFFF